MTYKRKKYHKGYTHIQKKYRLKRKTKDLDEIDEDLQKRSEQLLAQPVDLEKPGNAQYYCIHCARHFIDEHALTEHFRTKVHKRRMKALELEPYSVKESELAAGLGGNFRMPEKRKMETLLPKAIAEKVDVDEAEPTVDKKQRTE